MLPFANASGDPEQRYFSDGLTSDIVTELSRYGELAVMPCRAGPCEGSDADAREIGESLGVRYVLQGRVQSTSERIRVSVQLSDGRDGRSVWGRWSFESERTARDLFDLQDDLTRQVVNEIAGAYGVAGSRGAAQRAAQAPSEHLEQLRLCPPSLRIPAGSHRRESTWRHATCLEQVVEAEPDYVDGLAWLAYLYVRRVPSPLERARRRVRFAGARATVRATRGVARRRQPTGARVSGDGGACYSGDSERGIAELRRAVELNPNNPSTCWWFSPTTWLTTASSNSR